MPVEKYKREKSTVLLIQILFKVHDNKSYIYNDACNLTSTNFCCCQGNIALEKAKRRKPYVWMPDAGWEDCVRLAEIMPANFGSLLDDIERNEKAWLKVRTISCRIPRTHPR